MPHGLRLQEEEEEFQPGILPSQRGIKKPVSTGETDILKETQSRQGIEGVGGMEQGLGKYGREGQGFSSNWPSKPGQRQGLEEKKPDERSAFGRFLGTHFEQDPDYEMKEQLKEANERMKRGITSLAQGVRAYQTENLEGAVKYLGDVYEQVPDGGKFLGIVKPFDRDTISIANGAGVEKLISVQQRDGNMLYKPLDKANVEEAINTAKAAINPQNFIKQYVQTQAMIKAHNEDELSRPTLHGNNKVTYNVIDKQTGEKTTKRFDSREAFEAIHGTPNQGYRVPKGEVQRAEQWRKSFVTTPAGVYQRGEPGKEGEIVTETAPIEGFGPKGRGLTRKQIGELPKGEEVFATGLPRTTEKAPEIIAPSNITEMEIDGEKVSGLLLDNGNFVKTPNLAKVQKGKITKDTIAGMYQDFTKAYDAQFYDEDMKEYTEGAGSKEHREKWVEERVRQVLPRKYWRRPKLGPPQYSEKHEGWFAQDQLGEWWPVPNLAKPKPKKKLTLDEQIEKLGLTKPPKSKKPPKPRRGIKEPSDQTLKMKKARLPIR